MIRLHQTLESQTAEEWTPSLLRTVLAPWPHLQPRMLITPPKSMLGATIIISLLIQSECSKLKENELGSHEVGGDAPLPGDTQVIDLLQEGGKDKFWSTD
jgi:hypothetical protein